MARKYREVDFLEKPYEEFYQDHFFLPVSDEDAVNAHRIFPRVAWALDIAKEIKPKRVLDLGCLEGYAALTVANHCESVELVVGVDLSEDGIALARRRALNFPVSDRRVAFGFLQKSIEDYLRQVKTKFDFIMAFEIMEHVKDPELVLKLVDKVKSKKGEVLISTPAFESSTFGKDDEQNKCHVRLYTLKGEDYEEVNKYGTLRKATSLPKQIGKERIMSAEIYSELIHARYR